MKLCMGCMNQIEDNVDTCPHCGFNEATLQQESYYLNPGTVIGGKYIVGRVLSYGGHTVSYLGMDAEANRKVVVKEYLPSDFSTRSEGDMDVTIYSGDAQVQFEKGLTNFLNEASKIQALGSPEGIAKVYDCVAENDTGYVISEYVSGRTLKEILASGKKYSVQEAVTFISRILKGLSKVHPMNIVHCDIAPENIMITDSDEIKLLNFGATRYVTTANSKSLAIILKQGYAPEEMYRSNGKRGPWTDVYALGAVMYRMITGIVPQESVERTLVDELKEPSRLGVPISDNIENALMNALNIYQEERTPSAGAFLGELNSKSVKRIKVAKRKVDTGKFPIWAKGLVAAMLCVVIAGGAYVSLHGKKSNDKSLGKSGYEMPSFKDMAQEEAEKILKNKGYNIEIEPVDTYSQDNVGTIEDQSIPAGLFDPNDCEGIEMTADGTVSGVMKVWVRTDKKITFKDINDMGMSKFRLRKELNSLSDDIFSEEKEKDGPYGQIEYIIIDDQKYSADDIRDKKQEEKSYSIDKIDEIHFYAKSFFYWEEIPYFPGGKIKDKEQVYTKGDDGRIIPDGNNTKELKELGDNLIEYYVTFDLEKDLIVDQHLEKGSPFNQSEDMSKFEDGDTKLLDVIKEKLKKPTTTDPAKYKDELVNEHEFTSDLVGFDVDDINGREVTGLKLEKDPDIIHIYDDKYFYFLEEDIPKIKITIRTQEKKTDTQAPSGSQRSTQNGSSGENNNNWEFID